MTENETTSRQRERCEYLEAPDRVERVDPDGSTIPVPNPEPSLCSWALHAFDKLKDTPTWLQREAPAGHLWRRGDCDNCPCYTPKL